MAIDTPEQQFSLLKSKIEETIKEFFPVETSRSKLVLNQVFIEDTKGSQDLRGQREAIKKGRDWSVPVYADFTLQRDGEDIDRRRVRLMKLPKITDRYGYIVGGTEHQSLNQLRQRSGVYHQIAKDGEIRARFNLANGEQLANGKSFQVNLDPRTGIFQVRHDGINMPIYHLLKGAGVDDDTMIAQWGQEVWERNKGAAKPTTVYGKLYKKVFKKAAKDPMEHAALFGELLKKTQVSPETTEKTIGRAASSVDTDVILRATGNLLGISRGDRGEDNRTSLEFQSIHSFEDLINGHLRKKAWQLRRGIQGKLNKKRTVKSVVNADAFDRGINSFFTSSLMTTPEQTNPLEMVAGRMKTTLMGEQGGIKSPFAVDEESKLINPSHLGFLDPIHTPESEKTGISLVLPLGTRKRGNELRSAFVNAKTGRRVDLTPGRALKATVAFPDQYERLNRKSARLTPVSDRIKATRNGEIVYVKPSEVDYILPSARSVFGIATNLIPFLQNNQGNRAMTAARQQEQAVPLKHREAPLVQTQTDRDVTFEKILGAYSARRTPVDGVVHKIKDDGVVIKGARGKLTEVQLYRDFPLKGHTLYDSTVKVKKGDRVKAGDVVADTTFTKNGTLALGTNLRTAYMPFHGYNFEDGIVISDAAAKKLTSLHAYEKSVKKDKQTIIDRKQFLAVRQGDYEKRQLANIDDDGVVRVGSVVEEGDPLVLALREPNDNQYASQVREFRRGKPVDFKNRSLTWDKPFKGVVTDVYRKSDGRGGTDVIVTVKTEEPAQIGDKVVGRHGNKGVITRIIPTEEMPYALAKDGKTKKHVDIMLNPLGVPSRINLGQILETVAAKIAEERGTVYKVRNFEAGKNYLQSVEKELADAGLEDKETLYDPTTGKSFKQKVLTGNQYILKLKHQVEKKISARSMAGADGTDYDINLSPKSGAPHGGQALGELGMYSLLAHGARNNLFDMYAYKSNKNPELWDALREGKPLPAPKVPFVYDKFLSYLNAMRVNVVKDGNVQQLMPFTEKQVLEMSNGELKDPAAVYMGKNLKPEKGGLFDPDITGGQEGTKWSHFKLQFAMPNPLFEGPIRKLTGLSEKDFRAYIKGSKQYKGKTGGEAIEQMLREVDVDGQIADLQDKLKNRRSDRGKFHSKLRILRALKAAGQDPTVYMMRSVPVLPPTFRPITVREDGSLNSEDVNYLYKNIAMTNESVRIQRDMGMPEALLGDQRESLYDGLKALAGTGGNIIADRDYRGLLDIISGKIRKMRGGDASSGKEGFFQRRLIKRRQDFSARSIIIPEPRQGLDQLGLPEEIAWTQYQPFIERYLATQGYRMGDAIKAVRERTPAAEAALLRVMEERPVLLKRDPSLHKFNVMAFKPRLVRGKAIEIHPLVTAGYNADFDGDAMSVYLPITTKAVKEAGKLYPSNNLFSSTTGGVMYTPGHEALLGLYLLSQPGKQTNKKYKDQKAALAAVRAGEIGMTDIIRVGGHETTVGRLRLEEKLPAGLRETGKKKVKDMRVFNKGTTRDVLTQVARKHRGTFGEVANTFKDLGNEYSTDLGYSIGLSDFKVINKELRDKKFAAAEAKATAIRKRGLNKDEEDRLILAIFNKVQDEIDDLNDASIANNPTNISRMVASGSRGKPNQLKQIISSPIMVQDAKSRTVPYLIPKSYSEGMDLASYWTTLHGARKGTIQKVQGVRDPGYLSKQILNSTMNQLVTVEDCGTKNGIFLSVDDRDLHDRYLATGVSLGGRRFRHNALVDSKLIATAKKARRRTLKVRSPLRCEAEHGVCKKCAGLNADGQDYTSGDNLGVIAGQSVGEPSTQLALNAFHTGGIAKGKAAQSQSTFDRLNQLLQMPKRLPNATSLAKLTGRVSKIEEAGQGGFNLTIRSKTGKSEVEHYVPGGQDLTVKRGDDIEKGMALSDGLVNPRELLELKGIEAVQDFIVQEMHALLKMAAPVRRRNVEVVVRALTNVTRVRDADKHPDWISEDVRPTSQVKAWNRRNPDKRVSHNPYLSGINILPLEMSEDWVARLNYQRLGNTIMEGAARGWKSNVHGFHPIPAVALGIEFGQGKEKLKKGWIGQY